MVILVALICGFTEVKKKILYWTNGLVFYFILHYDGFFFLYEKMEYEMMGQTK